MGNEAKRVAALLGLFAFVTAAVGGPAGATPPRLRTKINVNLVNLKLEHLGSLQRLIKKTSSDLQTKVFRAKATRLKRLKKLDRIPRLDYKPLRYCWDGRRRGKCPPKPKTLLIAPQYVDDDNDDRGGGNQDILKLFE